MIKNYIKKNIYIIKSSVIIYEYIKAFFIEIINFCKKFIKLLNNFIKNKYYHIFYCRTPEVFLLKRYKLEFEDNERFPHQLMNIPGGDGEFITISYSYYIDVKVHIDENGTVHYYRNIKEHIIEFIVGDPLGYHLQV